MNIVLVGYRCSGKSSVGMALANKLNFEFVDTDSLVERQAGMSIQEIVTRLGWPRFRAMEQEIVTKVSGQENLIIATGGGVVLKEQNMERLRKNGFIVWLKASPNIIKERMAYHEAAGKKRPPLLADNSVDEIEQVLKEREPLYEMAADLVLDTTTSHIDQVCEAIEKEFYTFSRKGLSHGR